MSLTGKLQLLSSAEENSPVDYETVYAPQSTVFTWLLIWLTVGGHKYLQYLESVL